MDRYQIKLSDGRMIGPFFIEQIGELYCKGHLQGDEICRKLPDGNWRSLDDFSEIRNFIIDIIAKNITKEGLERLNKNQTLVHSKIAGKREKVKKRLAQKRIEDQTTEHTLENVSLREFHEFRVENKVRLDVAVIVEEVAPGPILKSEKEIEDKSLLKTLVRPLSDIEKEEVANLAKEREREERIKVNVQKKKNEIAVVKALPTEREIAQGKTVVMNIDSLLPTLNRDAEKMIVDSERKENLEKIRVRQEMEKYEEITVADESTKESSKKTGPKIILLLAIVGIIFLLLPDNDEKLPTEKIIYPTISFPRPFEVIDKDGSNLKLGRGEDVYRRKTYPAKIMAAKFFKDSLELSFKGNPALGKLLLVYAELLPFAKEKIKSNKKIFDLAIQAKNDVHKDVNVVMGMALFYKYNKKYLAATKVIESFIRGKHSPTQKLYAIFLDVLIDSGDFIKAGKIFNFLQKATEKTLEAQIAILNYLKVENNFERMDVILADALKKYSNSIILHLMNARNSVIFENYKRLAVELEAVKDLEFESNPVYYANYLELLGMKKVHEEKFEIAADYFKKSLELHESDELRSRLASLELGGGAKVNKLIKESKIFNLMQKGRAAINENRWEEAFRYAIEASDLSAYYIPAKLLLPEVQVKQGYFERAIKTLLKLQREYPRDVRVKFRLIDAYLESYKLQEANLLLSQLATSSVNDGYEFASLFGKYYMKKGDLGQTFRWLSESINRNPLNDNDYYQLAEVLLKNRKYSKGRIMLKKAMEVDPENIKYNSLYAKVLYELNDAETAIGYLRETLKNHPDNPKLRGDIAIYYYKSGQTKNFEDEIKKIEKLQRKDTALYELLIEASKLEDRPENVIKYYYELIDISPGNLHSRMELGEYLLDYGKYDEALEMFEAIKRRLDDYPELYYFIAKVHYRRKEYKLAESFAKKEIDNNPSLDSAYTLLGGIYTKQEKYIEAINKLREALKLNRNSINAMMNLAWIKLRQRHMDEAMNLYLRCLKLDPDNIIIQRELGNVYYGKGQAGTAIEFYRTYLSLSPNAIDRSTIEKKIRELQ